ALGKKMEAIAEIRQALKVDSLSLIINEALGFHLYLARDYAGAIEQHVRTLELDPTFVPAHSALGIAYLHQGAYDEAIQEFQRATNLSNGGTDYIAQLGQAYAKSGKKGETFKILRRLKELSTRVYVSPYYVALIYTALGDHDQVFKWLD